MAGPISRSLSGDKILSSAASQFNAGQEYDKRIAASPQGQAAIAARARAISASQGNPSGWRVQAANEERARNELRAEFITNPTRENTGSTGVSPTRKNKSRQSSNIDSSSSSPSKNQLPQPSTETLPPSLESLSKSEINQKSRIETYGSSQTQVFNINSFRSEINNNDVLPSHSYLVTFSPFKMGFPENEPLTNFVINKRSTLMMRCESIVLPTPSLLEEENIRRYGYGPVEKVPYGVQFSDVSITWLVDGNSEIIDFMHQWMNTIVMHDSPNANMLQSTNEGAFRDGLGTYFPFEVGYKDGYANPIVRVYVYNRQQQTVTEYEMFDVFPMNIQSQNLAWADENQVQKLTVNFAYTNMRVKAPRATDASQQYDNIEALVSPLEERKQPTDKGGRAAADRFDSPTMEVIQNSINSSSPNSNENIPQSPTSSQSAVQGLIVRTFSA
jgi:hypothetical protein